MKIAPYTSPPNLRLHALAIAVLTLCYQPILHAQTQEKSSNVGTVKITGEGDKLGNGLMIEEDAPKAKSTITRSAIEKSRSSTNPFQLLDRAPGVNTFSHDATGLFGGQMKMRGFNSDQFGMTVNGAPVNDSGNFSVFPQQYTDTENLCEVFATQGSADNESPHVGASGGNVGLVSCDPTAKSRFRFSQTFGGLNFRRSFVRVDTGNVGAGTLFFSYSKSKVDKWRGEGQAKREHMDAGWTVDFSKDTKLKGSILYNRAVNNNFLSATKAEYGTYGYKYDFTTITPQHLNGASGAQNENNPNNFGTSGTGATPRAKVAFNGYALNPFENYLLTSTLSSRASRSVDVSFSPYYWFGYGTGGTQQTTVAETSGATRLGGGIADINRDGDRSDTIGVYRGSVTKTHRPGATLKTAWEITPNNRLSAGLWMERAWHRQTAPATRVNNDGVISALWLNDTSTLITRQDGSLYQNRDWLTVSTGRSWFASDTITLMDSKLDVVPGIRFVNIDRDFTNYANEGTNSGATYHVKRSYAGVLPSLGSKFKVNDAYQLFANVSKNMRAPSNFVLSGWVRNPTYTNGQENTFTLQPNSSIKKETSWSYEAGTRYSGKVLNANATLYYTNFKNRIASAYNPDTNSSSDINVGDVTLRGVELELGTKPVSGFSLHSSATLNRTKVRNDLANSATQTIATAGKQLPDSPRKMFALALQYTNGPFLAELSGKYTGAIYSTLANDEQANGYSVANFNTAWRFGSTSWLRSPTIRLNISNLFNARYYTLNAGSGSNFTTTIDASKTGFGSPTYYAGAPRFTSINFTADF